MLFALAIAFAIAHTQSPLYFSNQHQYFVHGLADGGMGSLDKDWLANTPDPTPAFSHFVAFTHRYLNDWLVFQGVFFLLLCIYFLSLVSIATLVISQGPSPRRAQLWIGISLIVLHAGILRFASVKLFGVDYPWYFQCGVANQYVLGTGLQPSAFGVFLITAVAAFAHGRPVLAIVCSSAACLMHATYLLPAAMLTLGFMFATWRQGRGRAALLLGAGSLLLVLPAVIYSLLKFGPTSAEQFHEAQRILVDVRIPHHSVIRRWFAPIDALQIIWICLGIFLSRHSLLCPVMVIAAALALLLSFVQLATGNVALALLFPWRISSVLVPLATAVVFIFYLTVLAEELSFASRLTKIVFVILGVAVIGGIVIDIEGLGYGTNEREMPALEYVRDHKVPGNLYLIPVRVPTPSPGARGTGSTTFMPPPGSNQPTLIAVDLQRFRLIAGAPIYVDFKSIPYKDVDVLEWRHRIEQCQKWYKAKDWGNPAKLAELRSAGITHVLIQADQPIDAAGYVEVFADGYYRLYRMPKVSQ